MGRFTIGLALRFCWRGRCVVTTLAFPCFRRSRNKHKPSGSTGGKAPGIAKQKHHSHCHNCTLCPYPHGVFTLAYSEPSCHHAFCPPVLPQPEAGCGFNAGAALRRRSRTGDSGRRARNIRLFLPLPGIAGVQQDRWQERNGTEDSADHCSRDPGWR